MTSLSPMGARADLLVDEDRAGLERLLADDPRATVYLRSIVHEYGVSPTDALGHGRFYGLRRDRRLQAVVFVGNARNMTATGDPADVEQLLERVARGPVSPRLFVGPEEHAPAVRRFLAARVTDPRLDRKQASYVLERGDIPDLEPLELRPARETDVPAVVRAHAAMIEEDLLIPRAHLDLERLADLARERIAGEKIWVHVRNGELVFKTEEISRCEEGVLVGGVFTAPAHRGRGYASRAMASWARTLLTGPLTRFALHVNAVNTPAYRAYERSGFRRTGMLRLILTY